MTTSKQWNIQAFSFLMVFLIVLSTVFTPQTVNALGSLSFHGFNSPNFTKQLPMLIKPSNSHRNRNQIKGIDVSQYQGNIDWRKVAKDDIKFAFVRASYGKETDKKFKANAQGAYKNRIPVGAYHYATFTNTAGAKSQANHFIKLLKSVHITYPVVLDLEGNSKTQRISKSRLTRAALTFMDTVKKAGYQVMLYSNENFFLSHIDTNAVKRKGYDFWVANYIREPSQVSHKIWQHTSSGRVDGISTNVDLNFAYENFSSTRAVTVNKTHSNSIKNWMNDTYQSGIEVEKLNMSQLKSAFVAALQTELNSQYGTNLRIDGKLSSSTTKHLQSVSFKSGEQNPLIQVIQSALFYKGYYSGSPTGVWDDKTANAVKAFQNGENVSGSGRLNAQTMRMIFK